MTTTRSGRTVPRNRPLGGLMAICNIIEGPARTDEAFEQISAHVRSSGPTPPEGCRLVLLGRERAITIWDSPVDLERFLAERLTPAYQAAGLSLTDSARYQFDVDMLVAGDLAGMAP